MGLRNREHPLNRERLSREFMMGLSSTQHEKKYLKERRAKNADFDYPNQLLLRKSVQKSQIDTTVPR